MPVETAVNVDEFIDRLDLVQNKVIELHHGAEVEKSIRWPGFRGFFGDTIRSVACVRKTSRWGGCVGGSKGVPAQLTSRGVCKCADSLVGESEDESQS